MSDTYLVVTGADGKPVHGGARNVRDVPGEWTARCEAVKYKSGWNACTPEYLSRWLYTIRDEYLPIQVWECEVENATSPGSYGEVVGTRRKRTRCLGTMDAVDLRWLAADIACQALHLTDDPRPGECLLTVYEWCCGKATDDELRAAAEAASGVASGAASRGASWAAVAASRASWAASSRIILDYLEATA